MQDPMPSREPLWFLDTRVTVLISCSEGTDRISLLEHLAAHGDSPPLHIHRDEDEVFHILEGELRFVLGDRTVRALPGQSLVAPKGLAHTYRVEAAAGARWLTVTCGEKFERFVRAVGRPAERPGLPTRSGPPTAQQAQALAAIALQHGIELVGPPLA